MNLPFTDVKSIARRKSFTIGILTIFLVAAYTTLHLWTNPATDVGWYLLNLVPLYVVYFVFVYFSLKDPGAVSAPLPWLLIAAALIRLIVLSGPVWLSDDVYRYIWDGRISAAGINPYAYPPDHDLLFALRDNVIYPNINFREIATVYPPMAQLLFFLNTLIGDSVLSWKFILLFCEISLIFVLYRMIRHFSLHPSRLLIFIYNPLLIIETYQSGHLDLAGILVFWIAVLVFYRGKFTGGFLLFLGAALVKFLPLFTSLPFLIKRFRRNFVLLMLLFSAAIVPFTFSAALPMAGFFSYANRWAFNNFFFQSVTAVLRWLGIPTQELFSISLVGTTEIVYISPALVYKFIVFLIAILLIFDQLRKLKITADFKSINYLHASFFITALLLLLNPTVHPWYLLWCIPFLVFLPNWSWLAFTFLIQLSYTVLIRYTHSGLWKENIWITALEFIPFLILLAFEYSDRRNIRGWFIGKP